MIRISTPGIPRSRRRSLSYQNEAMVDEEVLALDDATVKPSFNALQYYGSSPGLIFFYVFDVLILAGRDLMSEALSVSPAV
jgi:ATP-dependent DNA ligase